MAGIALATGVGAQMLGVAANAAQTSHPAKAVNIVTYTGKDRQARLERLAFQERHLFIYSTTGDGISGLVSAFNILYPYVKVTFVSGPPAIMIGPIESAKAAGVNNWDVVMQTTVYELLLRQIGAIQPFYTPDARKTTPGFNVSGTNGTVWGLAQSQLLSGFMYNKNIIPNPPRTMQALLNPALAGKMYMPNTASGQQFVGAVFNAFGQKKGLQYLSKITPLAKLSGLSGTALINLVASGQIGADMTAQLSQAQTFINSGAPVGWVPMLSAANVNLTMVSKNAPDIGAALLWADFASSQLGSAAVRAQAVIPATQTIKTPAVSAGGLFFPAHTKGLTSFKFDQLSNLWQTYLTQYFH